MCSPSLSAPKEPEPGGTKLASTTTAEIGCSALLNISCTGIEGHLSRGGDLSKFVAKLLVPRDHPGIALNELS